MTEQKKLKGIIMVQGTTSGAGKTTITMGICRYLANKGVRVAPFKPQNMTTSHYTLSDGGRIASSQGLEAVACRISADRRMNPVLLAPLPQGGCEVVVLGESHGTYPPGGYNKLKAGLKASVIEAFQSLRQQYDVVVVEGSGSPVELNLWAEDIANMGFAVAVNCPVLLVGDISRGGVFASLYGTVKLLPPKEQSLIQGLVVNKLKGRAEFFQEGVAILEEITGVPVLGVLPHIPLVLEDEDNLTDDGVMKTKKIITDSLNSSIDYNAYRDQQLDLLAEQLSAVLDVEKLEHIIMQGNQWTNSL